MERIRARKRKPRQAEQKEEPVIQAENSQETLSTKMAAPLRAAAILNSGRLGGVQRQALVQNVAQNYGNKQVQRVLASVKSGPGNTAIQRTIGDGHDLTSPRFAGNRKLEACFDDEERLSPGASGPTVVTIQQALIDLGFDLGSSGADGIYGNKTAAAVRQFKADNNLGSTQFGDVGPGTMTKLNELFPPTPVPIKPDPPNKDDPPKKDQPQTSAEFEDTLDAILNTLQFTLTARRDGLDQTAGQLRKDDVIEKKETLIDKAKSPAEDGIKSGIEKIVEALPETLGKLVKLADPGISALVTAGVEFAAGLAKPADTEDDAKVSTAEVFIEAQKKTVTDHSFEVQQEFLVGPTKETPKPGDTAAAHTKKQLRQIEQNQPGEGLKQAKTDLEALKKARKTAQDEQRKASLSAWFVLRAQESLGKKFAGNPDTDILTDKGTDLAKIKNDKVDTTGVAEVKIFLNGFTFNRLQPKQDMSQARMLIDHDKGVKLPGMKPDLMKAFKESYKGKTLKDLKIPLIGRGVIKDWKETKADGTQIAKDSVPISIGLNEVGTGFALPEANRAEAFNFLRLTTDKGLDIPSPGLDKEDEGARIVLQDQLGNDILDNMKFTN